jgi:hypothetical protein
MSKPKTSRSSARKTTPRKTTRPAVAPTPPVDPTTDAALLALPLSSAAPPDIPVEVARQELASLARLAKLCATDLAKVGISLATIDLAARFAAMLARKQKAWDRARKAVTLKAADRKLLEEAELLDAKLVAGGRWALRRDPAAQAELTRIAEGSGLLDTLQDLRDLQAFWDEHAEHRSKTLITDKDLARAGTLVDKLESAAEKEAADVEATRALDLRNRAFWAAHELAQDIRDAGRYAYAGNPKLAAKFTSRYRSTAVKRTRGKQGKRGASPIADTVTSPASANE